MGVKRGLPQRNVYFQPNEKNEYELFGNSYASLDWLPAKRLKGIANFNTQRHI